ncbi:MAG: hypothetical protein HND44_00450 [Chloroflexi bacterium]|nr:ORF6C domain-containing protein [Ardenticatenaceae bacterium]MBL1126974.1 hypothetical protein [Chloroflexota bacterium]NOG33032.1 hypothetical protein [Chloroflexota bacterium]GIK54669.1 MAG: hypothetical protein BroJett015_03320 [Chloroflexota bacterium]
MTKKLIIIEQREVQLYEDMVMAVRTNNGQIYVSIKHMCHALGLDDRSQRRRIQTHSILAEGYQRGDISTPPSEGGRGGGRQEATLLRVDLVPLWLAGIEAGKVAENMRAKLENFQRGAAAVLWEAFQEGRLTADPDFDTLLKRASADAVEAYQMALAVVKLARNQIMIEARLDDYGRRLEAIEATLSVSERFITREQASRISQAVRAIGHVLSERGGRSEYGAVYGELYRNFEISAYRELPAQKYDEAMKWLNAWYQRLTNQDIPF